MLKMARVVKSHPESHAVDLVMMEDGRRFAGVQVMAGVAGGDVGSVDLPEPSVTDPQKPYESSNTGVRDMYAAVAFMGGMPLVLGFIYPQVSQALFGGEMGRNRKLYRHASDVYHTIDGAGNMELHHPSGAYVRIGQSPEHEDLTGHDYDKIWGIGKNTNKSVHIHIEQAGKKASIDIDPAGNIHIKNTGTTNYYSKGDIAIKSDTHISLIAPRIDFN